MNFSKMEKQTLEALDNPQVGDRFHELFSFWVYVVAVDDNSVTTIEGSPPVTFPDEGKVKAQTKEEFKQRFLYKTIPGAWIMLSDRDNDVEGWLENNEH